MTCILTSKGDRWPLIFFGDSVQRYPHARKTSRL